MLQLFLLAPFRLSLLQFLLVPSPLLFLIFSKFSRPPEIFENMSISVDGSDLTFLDSASDRARDRVKRRESEHD